MFGGFRSNRELVNHLINRGVLKTDRIIEAFLKVDRADFVRKGFLDSAYGDFPLPIGEGQTISQPYTVAFMLELLQPEEDSLVLDVGCGSCWTTALLATIAKKGRVIGVEIVKELIEFCKGNLEKYNFDNVEIYNADKLPPGGGTFDRILVSAAARELPEVLVNAMKENAIMVIPINSSIFKVEKRDGILMMEEHYGFAFVELK